MLLVQRVAPEEEDEGPRCVQHRGVGGEAENAQGGAVGPEDAPGDHRVPLLGARPHPDARCGGPPRPRR